MKQINTLNSTDIAAGKEISAKSKISDYVQFIKLRLSLLVVFSAAIGFVIASRETGVDWLKMTMLVFGGFLVTGSSNGFNQIIEKDLDKLMTRTASRPLPTGRMTEKEAYIIAFATGTLGVLVLWIFMNPLSGILGFTALLLYTMFYTPMKQQTPFAVFIGAFPGAIPPLLGCVAATDGFGHISNAAWVLFFVQFMWQFPHFWAIAWVADDDYKKAGFYMLPSRGGRDKKSAFQILIYTLFLVPISLAPVFFKISGNVSFFIILICGIVFSYQAYQLFKDNSIDSARKLMFGSFIYLPIVQLATMLG